MGYTAISRGRGISLIALAVVTVAGGLVWTVWGWNARAALAGTNFYFWFLLCLCGELLRTRSASGQAMTTMAACPHLACLLVLRRPEAMAVVGLASMVSGRLVHKRSWAHSAFEAGAVTWAVGLSRLVFDALAKDGLRPSAVVASGYYGPILAAAAVYFGVSFVARCLWSALEEGRSPWTVSRAQFGSSFDFLAAGALLSLGMLLAVQFRLAGALGAIALVIPVVVAKYGFDQFVVVGKHRGEAASRREVAESHRERVAA